MSFGTSLQILEVNSTAAGMSEDYYMAGRHRYYEDVGGVFLWKMPGFDLSESGIDELIDKAKSVSR